MASTTGRLFRVTTFGESHGVGVGCVVDGCPPRLRLDLDAVQSDLDRRRPGQSRLVTQRQEADRVEVLSGVAVPEDENAAAVTLGTPIAMVVRNADQRPGAYGHLSDVYRPSHADYTYDAVPANAQQSLPTGAELAEVIDEALTDAEDRGGEGGRTE